MTLTQQTDHEADALALLLHQLHGALNLEAFLASFIAQVQELENEFFNLLEDRSLDTAEGAQLDALGTIIGLARVGGQDDDTYRDRLKVEILMSLSSGTIEDVLTIVERLLDAGNTAWLRDGPIAEFDLEIVQAIENGPEIATFVNRARAAGVRATTIWADAFADTDQYFSFGPDNDINGQDYGFDNGGFVAASEG